MRCTGLIWKNLMSKMTRKSGTFVSLEEGLRIINDGKRNVNYNGTMVHVSESLRTFRKGCDCVRCGAKGSHFRLKGNNPAMLRLHVRTPDGNCQQLTSDHIWPKKLGGPEGLWNRQPMCAKCNRRKGHNVDMSTRMFIVCHKIRIYVSWKLKFKPYHYERLSAKIIRRLTFSQ